MENAVKRLVDFLARGPAVDASRGLLRVCQVHEPVLRNAHLGRRLGQGSTPLLKQLAVLGVARQADDDQEKRSKHHESPTARR